MTISFSVSSIKLFIYMRKFLTFSMYDMYYVRASSNQKEKFMNIHKKNNQQCNPVGCLTHKEGGEGVSETNPQIETLADRDPSAHRPPVSRVSDSCKNITLPQVACGFL